MPFSQRGLLLLGLAALLCGGHAWSQDYIDSYPTYGASPYPGARVFKQRTKVVYRGHCQRCKKVAPCGCASPMVMPAPAMPVIPAVPQTTYEPVYETQYRQQQIVTSRPIVETQYRTEAYTETVPVTRYQSVTVDEGHWTQVWCPKPVTKQVPQTVYEQRQNCRVVPFQVQKCVPEVSTRMVPYQTVRYVAKQTCVPGCTPGATSMLPYSPTSYPQTSYLPSTYAPAPSYASTPTPSYAALPGSYNMGHYDSQPVPPASYLDTPQPSHYSHGIDNSYSPPQAIPARQYSPTSYAEEVAPRYGARFNTPSAATVWHSSNSNVVR